LHYNQGMVRTRLAPSPTGENLHIGNVYTALINYVFAHKNKGKFIIRVEDTDRTRLIAGSEERILASLKWVGLNYDEGPDIGGPFAPYRQSERKNLYKKYAEELAEKKSAYYCFCDSKRLEEMRRVHVRYDGFCKKYSYDRAKEKAEKEPYVIRLNVPQEGKTEFNDVIHGKISFENNLLDDQILLKSDGFPTYHLGVVIDDHLMEITHIIRAEEWISSTPKHILIYKALGWNIPVFAHTPILRNPDKSKFSKRKNPVWVSWYREEGFLPEAILNYLALMGWSHPEGKEIFSLEQLVSVFRLEDVKPVGPIFDLEKLKWMNGMYIRTKRLKDLSNNLIDFNPEYKRIEPELFKCLVALAQTRIQTLKDLEPLVKHFLIEPKTVLSSSEKAITQNLLNKLSALMDWKTQEILNVLRGILLEKHIKMKVVYKILTGNEQGLPIAESLELLGRDRVLKRLKENL